MVAAIAGTIKSVDSRIAEIIDKEDGKTKEIILPENHTITVGLEGVFVGNYSSLGFVVKHINLRKFLDPLYEEDLISASGRYTLLNPINNPFPELWEKLIKSQEEKELEDAEDVENNVSESSS